MGRRENTNNYYVNRNSEVCMCSAFVELTFCLSAAPSTSVCHMVRELKKIEHGEASRVWLAILHWSLGKVTEV